MTYMQSRIRGGPGLGQNGQPINAPWSTLCHCSCHPPQKPPPAVEARLCQECADERFTAWQSLVEVLMHVD
jgi:hypothetical protein